MKENFCRVIADRRRRLRRVWKKNLKRQLRDARAFIGESTISPAVAAVGSISVTLDLLKFSLFFLMLLPLAVVSCLSEPRFSLFPRFAPSTSHSLVDALDQSYLDPAHCAARFIYMDPLRGTSTRSRSWRRCSRITYVCMRKSRSPANVSHSRHGGKFRIPFCVAVDNAIYAPIAVFIQSHSASAIRVRKRITMKHV